MQPMWHGFFAVALIALFFSMVSLIAYQLYGPGIHFDVPDYFLPAGWATSTKSTLSDPLANYPGTRFECDAERALKVNFSEGIAQVTLSDGRRISLPQIVSTRGARYANADESFVFQTNDVGAFIEENGVMTYANCVPGP